MINKAKKYLSKYMSKRKSYLIVYWSYFFIVNILTLSVGYLFGIIPFIIISTIVFNSFISVTYGFHLSNVKCIFLTICLLIIFGFISKTIPMEWSFLIGLFCMRDIYIRSPLKLIVKGKDLNWHENRIMLMLAICLVLSIVGLYFNSYTITNSIMCSIIMVDLTLFKNKNEERV